MKVDSNSLINIFKEIDAISIKEVCLCPTEDGEMTIYGMDPSMTAVVSGKVKAAAFPDGCTLENEVKVPIPFMLDALEKDKECDMTFNDGNITLKYGKSKRTRRLIAPTEEPRPVPSIELPDSCVLMSDDVVAVMKMSCFQDIKTDNDGITIKLDEDGMVFEALSTVESAEIHIEGTTALENEECKSVFGVKVIAPILKALPKATILTVSNMSDCPIKISIDDDKYSMDIFIAPFIVEE